jgi:DNA-binding NarL/FixJ family response regulator
MRDGLRTMLSATSDIAVTGTTDDRGRTLDAVDRTGPDVVLVGLSEPAEAVDLVHRILGAARRQGRTPPSFVVLYNECRSQDMAQLIAADVRGLIRRDATRSEVIDAIHRVVRGQTAFSPEIVDRLRTWFLRKGTVAAEDTIGATDALTQREREILVLIGRGSSPEDIAQSLFIGLTTVRTHIYRIRHKLSLKDRAQLVAYAYRTGLVERLAPVSGPLAS